MKYKKRLFLTVFLMLLVPIALNTLLLSLSMVEREETLTNDFIAVTSAQLQSTMDYFVKRLQTDMVYLSSRQELQELADWYGTSDFREKRNFFQNLDPFARLSDYYDEAYLVHPRDDLMLDLKNKFIVPIGNSAVEETIHRLNNTLESYTGEKDLLLSIEEDGESVTYLIRSVRNAISGTNFYLYLRLNEYFFRSLLEDIFMIDRSFVVIVNQNDQVVVMRSRGLEIDREDLPSALSSVSSGREPLSVGGDRFLVAAAESEETGWRYVYGVDYSGIRAEILASLFRTGLITFAIAGLFAILSYLLSNALYRPISSLVDSLELDHSIPETDEFSRIQNHIKNLAERNRLLGETVAENRPYRKERSLQALLRGSPSAGENLDLPGLGESLAPSSGDRFLVIEALLRNAPEGVIGASRRFSVVEPDATIAQWFHFSPGVFYETLILDETDLVFVCRLPKKSSLPESSEFDLLQILSVDREIEDTVFLGYSSLKDSVTDLSEAYKEARVAVEYRTLFPGRTFISFQGIIGASGRIHFYPFIEEMKLINAVKQRDEEAAVDQLAHFFDILAASGLPFHRLRHAAYHLQDALLKVVGDFDLHLESSDVEFIEAASDRMEAAILPEELLDETIKVLELLQEKMKDGRNSTALHIAEGVKDFIDRNYADRNLSLDQIADEVKYSVSHISAIFKTTYGETVKQYITRNRLAKAKELLISTRTKVESIGKESGYDNVGSFVKIFKAYTGETPKNFRLRHREDPEPS